MACVSFALGQLVASGMVGGIIRRETPLGCSSPGRCSVATYGMLLRIRTSVQHGDFSD